MSASVLLPKEMQREAMRKGFVSFSYIYKYVTSQEVYFSFISSPLMITLSIVTVSYTHLDVYKRQLLYHISVYIYSSLPIRLHCLYLTSKRDVYKRQVPRRTHGGTLPRMVNWNISVNLTTVCTSSSTIAATAAETIIS